MKRTLLPALAFVVATWAVAANGQTTQGGDTGSQSGQSGTTTQGQTGGATDQNGGQSGTTSTSGAQTGTEGQPGATASRNKNDKNEKSSSDQQKFVEKAAIANIAEIQMSQLAVQKAQDPQVKQFAQEMVDQHTKAGDELKQIAGNSGLQLPTELDKKHAKIQDKLSELDGARFDRQFLKDMIASHKEAEKLLKSRAKNGSHMASSASGGYGATGTAGSTGTSGETGTAGTSGSGTSATAATTGTMSATDLNGWASMTLPTVQSHLQEAQRLEKSVKQNEKGKGR